MRRVQVGGNQGRGNPAVTMRDRPRIRRERVTAPGMVSVTTTVYGDPVRPWWRDAECLARIAIGLWLSAGCIAGYALSVRL